MDKEKLSEYAKLIVEVGVNLQKGQSLLISCPVDCAYFARMLADCAYNVGAKDVIMDWHDDYISRKHWLMADDSLFDRAYSWQSEKRNSLAREGCAFIAVDAEDPENLKGVSADRLKRWDIAAGRDFKEFYKLETSNGFPWCIASVPIKSWAQKVFPDDRECVEKLWDEIFKCVRISGDGKAVEKWKSHCDLLESRAQKLNKLNFSELHYTNSLGTDLVVKLPKEHVWLGGGDVCKSGVRFIANMPTEEVFGAPEKNGVDGVVYSSKPLSLNGNVVEGIRLTLKEGRIIEIHADKNEETLKAAIETDEGAHYFGEIALVPKDSPISKSGVLFYNTLFDENASCHFAFGEAYAACIKNGDNLTTDELLQKGINADSCTHVDFMVGTEDLSIVGKTRDGKTLKVFEMGNFVI